MLSSYYNDKRNKEMVSIVGFVNNTKLYAMSFIFFIYGTEKRCMNYDAKTAKTLDNIGKIHLSKAQRGFRF